MNRSKTRFEKAKGRNVFARLVSAAVALGETTELQKSNTEQREQLNYLLERLRRNAVEPRIPKEHRKDAFGALKTVSQNRRWLDEDRDRLEAKAEHFRDLIDRESARLLKHLAFSTEKNRPF